MRGELMDYQVVVVRSEHQLEAKDMLEKKVKELLETGWQLQGGVSASVVKVGFEDDIVLIQAMTK